MPKGKAKCKTQDLCFEEEDVIKGRKEPSPKLKTIATDYRLKRESTVPSAFWPRCESPEISTYRNVSAREARARNNARNCRRQSRSPSSDGTSSHITVKAAPLLPKRNYNINWRSTQDRPSNVTSWRQRARSPAELLQSYHLRSNMPRRDYGRWKAQGWRKSPRLASPEKFHETFTLKLTTDETVQLRGLHSRKLYATFPEGTYIIADAQNKEGNKGDRVFQVNKSVQVPEGVAELSTFQNSFGKMRL
jgi:hypothetical protein